MINALNVFKILGLRAAQKGEKNHTVYLEYGSSKAVEEKVKKSEHLLEAEYNYKVNCRDLKKARE